MKKLLIALTIATLSFAASAEDKQSQCTEISDFAGNIMTLRQLGKPMADTFKISGGSKFVESIIIEAYEHPKFSTEEYRKESVSKFKNKYFLMCIKS